MIKRIHSFKFKLILFFLIITIIIFTFQVGVSQYLITTIIAEKSSEYFQEAVKQIGKRVDLQIKLCNEISQNIANNQVLKNYLKDLKYHKINYNIAKYKITREILKITNLEMVDSIYIFTEQYSPINCYYSIPILEMDSYTRSLLKDNSEIRKEEILWTALQTRPFKISAFSCINDEMGKLGVLKINFNETFLSTILDEVQLGKEGKIYLAGNYDEIIFAKDRNMISEPFKTIEKVSGPILRYALAEEEWMLIGIIPQTEVENQISRINRIFFLIAILIFLTIAVFAIFVIKAILKPLNKIMKGMECIQQGNLNIMLESDSNNEFSVIIHNFNYMVERIKSLVETVYHQQIHYRKAEMSALQAKLNPHFLYNTLDGIYWMLILKGEEEIAKLIVALSNILRYSISHENEFVTVREDMGQLENYLEIQRMRFEDKLQYFFNMSEDIWELKIPKLLIQPLVENSIKHAFHEMRSHGIIMISGYQENNYIIFEVSDNGVGISEEKIHSIFNAHEFQNKKSGIGIKMVHHRIGYIYGDGYGISVQSTPGEGTKITVRLGKKAEFNQEELFGT